MSVPAAPALTSVAARVRVARLSDLDALVALERACFAGERASRRTLRHAVRSPTMNVLVAIADDGAHKGGDEILVGAATLERRSNACAARLSFIAVSPSRVGRGLGGLLLDAVEAEAAAKGYNRLRLETHPGNGAAIRLYERHGFKRYAVRPDYYEDGATAWCYEKIFDAM